MSTEKRGRSRRGRGRSPTPRENVNASFDMDGEKRDAPETHGRTPSHAAPHTSKTRAVSPSNYWMLTSALYNQSQPRQPSRTTSSSRHQEQTKRRRRNQPNSRSWTRGTFRRGSSKPASEKQQGYMDKEEVGGGRDSPPIAATGTTNVFVREAVPTDGMSISTAKSRSSSKHRRRRKSHHQLRKPTSVTPVENNSNSVTHHNSHRSNKTDVGVKSGLHSHVPADEIISVAKKGMASDELSVSTAITKFQSTVQRRSILLRKIPRHLSRLGRVRSKKTAPTLE